MTAFLFNFMTFNISGSSSVGRALASQAKGREFESLLPLRVCTRNKETESKDINYFLS